MEPTNERVCSPGCRQSTWSPTWGCWHTLWDAGHVSGVSYCCKCGTRLLEGGETEAMVEKYPKPCTVCGTGRVGASIYPCTRCAKDAKPPDPAGDAASVDGEGECETCRGTKRVPRVCVDGHARGTKLCPACGPETERDGGSEA